MSVSDAILMKTCQNSVFLHHQLLCLQCKQPVVHCMGGHHHRCEMPCRDNWIQIQQMMRMQMSVWRRCLNASRPVGKCCRARLMRSLNSRFVIGFHCWSKAVLCAYMCTHIKRYSHIIMGEQPVRNDLLSMEASCQVKTAASPEFSQNHFFVGLA